ncbi:hypothetical protein V8V91_23795 [Algoriphagus halophilus]|uniref:hypothetical protein n=1 Tax=Algoriphagus halophilus TaxID=226505 RepID=UPI00358E071C
MDPLVQFDANKLYLLFPNSPELYEYQLPELTLVDQLDLNPEENYKLIEPAELGSNQEFLKAWQLESILTSPFPMVIY